MPRRNKSPKLKKSVLVSTNEQAKIRYRTKREAENAIKEIKKYNLDASLRAYQSPIDGMWYLTSNQ